MRRAVVVYDAGMTGAAQLAAAAVAAYAVGMFPTALLVGRRIGRDPTAEGSRNPGASNMYRIGGRLAGLAVVVGDMSKGAGPTLAALLLWGRPAALAAWLGAVAGHVWPVLPRLSGGKGVATISGGAIVLDPLAAALCSAVFAAVVRLSKVAALGSLTIAAVYPTIAAVTGWPISEILVALAVMAVTVVRHRSNIARLLRGTELEVRA